MTNFSEGLIQTAGPYERVVRNDWNLSDAKSLIYTPQKGRTITAISMGWSDESGGVRIDSPDVPGALPLTIDSYSPFIGNVRGPFTVYPTVQISDAVYAASARHILDMLVWYDCLPPVFPLRGPKLAIGTLDRGETAVQTIMGRKRTSIYLINNSGGNLDAAIYLTYYTPSVGVSSQIIYNATMANGAVYTHELNSASILAGSGQTLQTIPTAAFQVTIANADAAEDNLDYRIETRDY